MQKKLIAAAVAMVFVAPAMAQNVTVSGSIKSGYESYRLGSAPSGSGPLAKSVSESRVSDQSSRVIISGNEDLGNGLKAWFQVDSRLSTDLGAGNSSTGWAAGNTGIGLQSAALGKVTIGRWDLHYNSLAAIEGDRAGSLQSLAGIGLLSQVYGSQIAIGSRANNVIMYDTPTINGLTGKIAYSTNAGGNEGGSVAGSPLTSTSGSGKAVNLRLDYVNGPVVAGYSYWNYGIEGAAASGLNQRADRLYVGYSDPSGLKVGFAWDKSQLENVASVGTYGGLVGGVNGDKVKRTGWMIPVSYEFGGHALRLVYAKVGKLSGVDNNANTGAKFWKLGYDYALSKRTSAGVYYTVLDNDSAAAYKFYGTSGLDAATATSGSGAVAPTVGQDAKQLYIGVAHSF